MRDQARAMQWRLLCAGSIVSLLSLAVLLLAGPDLADAALVGLGAVIALPLALAVAAAVLVPLGARRPVPVPRRHDGWESFEHELARSRRHEHPFVLIRIPPQKGRLASGGHVTARPSAPFAPAVAAFLRRIDVVWTDEDGTWVLLPESGRATGEAMLERLRVTAPSLVPEVGVRLAMFPEDGLTKAGLIEHMTRVGATSDSIRVTGPDAMVTEPAELSLDRSVG